MRPLLCRLRMCEECHQNNTWLNEQTWEPTFTLEIIMNVCHNLTVKDMAIEKAIQIAIE